MTASKSRLPASIKAVTSAEPTMSAPAASASAALGPSANTATRMALPVPWGRATDPRTIWSALRGSMPSRRTRSTVGSNETVVVSLTSFIASEGLYSRSGSTLAAAT